MPEPSFENDIDHDALLIGQVTIAWNGVQAMVHAFFLKFSGMPLDKANAVFFALKQDSAQRDITLAVCRTSLGEGASIWPRLKGCFNAIETLAGERNATIHTLWAIQMPAGVLIPHPTAIHHRKLQVANHRQQFKRLREEIGRRFDEMVTLFAEAGDALREKPSQPPHPPAAS